MGKEKKKGTSGTAVSFMTRNAALKKLQLSLGEFRRLCILKGIFPRDPKKKPRGKNKTYYFTKDIIFLSHDPLLEKFREFRALKRKVKRAQAKNDPDAVARLRRQTPKFSLEHIVRERYPRFVDALQDVDDALCMLHAFARLPNSTKVKGTRVANCARLCREFDAYVARTHALRKVFVSIKGIYYQAQVFGQTVTWLSPHRFQPQVSRDVDLKVMTHFSEFYESMMQFVNYKLYNSIGLKYPPQLDSERDASGGGLDALLLQLEKAEASGELPKGADDADETSADAAARQPSATELASAQRIETLDSAQLLRLDAASPADAPVPMSDESEPAADDPFAAEQRKAAQHGTLFAGCKFFLAREVPHESLAFAIRSFGGQVSLEGPGAAYPENDQSITHQVVDRTWQAHQFLSRSYVQPQWVFDSVNELSLLPTERYAPGAELPPHLSPFVDDAQEGYTPLRREELERIKQGLPEQVQEAIAEAEMEAVAGSDSESDEEDEDTPLEIGSKRKAADEDDEEEDSESEGDEQDGTDEEASEDGQPGAPDEAESESDADEEVDELEARYQAELRAERKGLNTPVASKAAKPKSTEKVKAEDQAARDETRLPQIMMRKKDKRLYDRMMHGKKQKQRQVQKLMTKRRESMEADKQRKQQASKKQRK